MGRKTVDIYLLRGLEYDGVAPHYGWIAEASDSHVWALLYFPALPSGVSSFFLLPVPRLAALISFFLSKSQMHLGLIHFLPDVWP